MEGNPISQPIPFWETLVSAAQVGLPFGLARAQALVSPEEVVRKIPKDADSFVRWLYPRHRRVGLGIVGLTATSLMRIFSHILMAKRPDAGSIHDKCVLVDLEIGALSLLPLLLTGRQAAFLMVGAVAGLSESLRHAAGPQTSEDRFPFEGASRFLLTGVMTYVLAAWVFRLRT